MNLTGAKLFEDTFELAKEISMKRYYHYKAEDAYQGNDYVDGGCRYGHKACKPKARSKIMGVCAGIARQLGWDVTGVRIVAVLGLFFMTGPTLLAYIIAGALFY